MLDIMEMRGFEVVIDHREEPYLRTPDGYAYYVQRLENVPLIKSIFTTFEHLNLRHP